jgi:hypothetical protein
MAKQDLSNSGDVYFEFVAIGHSVKVTAIHAVSGVEVSVLGPASAARSDLELLALQKLVARLGREGGSE